MNCAVSYHDRDCAVDEPHAVAGHYPSYDHVCRFVRGGLQQGSDDHDHHADEDAASATEPFTDEACGDGAKEAADLVL